MHSMERPVSGKGQLMADIQLPGGGGDAGIFHRTVELSGADCEL